MEVSLLLLKIIIKLVHAPYNNKQIYKRSWISHYPEIITMSNYPYIHAYISFLSFFLFYQEKGVIILYILFKLFPLNILEIYFVFCFFFFTITKYSYTLSF